jgi:type III restriction enzyme
MKLKFDPSLQYQQDAINAVVGVFEGQPFALTGAMAFQSLQIGGLFQTELGMGNRLTLQDDDILKNVHSIQEANGIEKVASLEGREFSVEMETGTGKTYVYLRTILELNKTYGFRKFIIVVPSVAIREGVLKSIDVMKEHFETLYDKAPFDHFVYDSKRLGKVRQFAGSNQFKSWSSTSSPFRRMLRTKTSRK